VAGGPGAVADTNNSGFGATFTIGGGGGGARGWQHGVSASGIALGLRGHVTIVEIF
jgi:hypothetical protein